MNIHIGIPSEQELSELVKARDQKYSTDSFFSSEEKSENGLLDASLTSDFKQNESYYIESSIHSNGVSHYEVKVLGKDEGTETKLAFTSPKNFIYGVLALLLFLIGNSTIAPFVLALPAKSAFIGMAWRNQSAVVFCIPIMVFMYTGKNQLSFKEDFHPLKLAKSAIAGFLITTWATGFTISCQYITTAHADIIYCSTSLFVFALTVLACKYVHKYETYGYIIFIAGLSIMVTDASALKKDGETEKVKGCLIALVSAVFGALYCHYNEQHSRSLHPLVLVFQMFFFICLFQLMLFPFFLPEKDVISFDTSYGVFGWLADLKICLSCLFIVGPLTSVICNYFHFRSFRYWPLEVVSAALLTEPIIAESAALLLGQDELPGTQTLIGIAIISGGLMLAMQGTKIKILKDLAQQNLVKAKDLDKEMQEL